MAQNEIDLSGLNIYQRLAKIRKPVEVLQKNKKGYGYTYANEELILSKITGLMDKYEVSLIPSIVHSSATVEPYHYIKTKAAKDGKIFEEHVNEVMVKADMEWVWVCNDRPEDRIVVPWILVGTQADASQSFGSALTYSSRYFLLKYFNAATSDEDPDEYRRRQKEAEEEENKLLAEGINEKIHNLVTEVLTKDSSLKPKVIEVTKKYIKSANYFEIENPVVASNLFTALKNEFIKTTKEEM